jgi:outer membrane murein-binding lipoprotein Lpp
MRSRLQVRVHINRALRSGTVEQKLDEIALAIAELARYVEDIEKDKLNRSSTALAAQHTAEGRRRCLAL